MAAALNSPCQRCKGYLLLQSTAHLADGNKIRIIRTIYLDSFQSQIHHKNFVLNDSTNDLQRNQQGAHTERGSKVYIALKTLTWPGKTENSV